MLTVEMWPVDKPIAFARNPRVIPQQAIDKVAASIKEYSFRQPLVVDEEGVIIIGHTRLLAAQKLGLAEVPVHVATGLSKAQKSGLRLADNRTNQEASWNESLLAFEFEELKSMDFDLSLTGFDADEIAEFTVDGGTAELTDEDAVPEVQERVITELGDIWLCGKHRVMAGDSTDATAVARLMDGAKADMVFTDPPYGVAYKHDNRPAKRPHKFEELENDDVDLALLLPGAFSAMFTVMKDGAVFYVWHAHKTQSAFEEHLVGAGFKISQQIIWEKGHFAFGRFDYHFQHEPCFYGWKQGVNHQFFGERNQGTVWNMLYDNGKKTAGHDTVHPTQKPVGLADKAIGNSSKAGDIVLDLFGGSGSTLIACDKTGRMAFLMELDPKYIDVIIRRWQEFSGKQATLESDGRTFEAVASERATVAA